MVNETSINNDEYHKQIMGRNTIQVFLSYSHSLRHSILFE